MRSEILFSITTCGLCLSCSLGYKTESPPGSWLNCSTSLKRLFYIIFSPNHRIIFHDQQTECIKQAVTSELFFIWSGKTRTLPLIPDIVDSKLEATYDCGEAAWTLLDCFSLKLRNGKKWINSVGTTYNMLMLETNKLTSFFPRKDCRSWVFDAQVRGCRHPF